MKKVASSIIVLFVLLSCQQEPGEITVINKLPKAKLTNIKWGELTVDNQLLPGEQSQIIKIYKQDYRIDLPDAHPVTFLLTVNSSTVFLETTQIFNLDLEESLSITIDSATEVRNSFFDE